MNHTQAPTSGLQDLLVSDEELHQISSGARTSFLLKMALLIDVTGLPAGGHRGKTRTDTHRSGARA
jgi:hypothetical protein